MNNKCENCNIKKSYQKLKFLMVIVMILVPIAIMSIALNIENYINENVQKQMLSELLNIPLDEIDEYINIIE